MSLGSQQDGSIFKLATDKNQEYIKSAVNLSCCIRSKQLTLALNDLNAQHEGVFYQMAPEKLVSVGCEDTVESPVHSLAWCPLSDEP